MHSSSSQKTNIQVSTDMQSTNYTIQRQIQNNKATVNWSDLPAVIQVSLTSVRQFILISPNKNQQTVSY